MLNSVTYVCPACGSTKTIVMGPQPQTFEKFFRSLPSSVVCGVRGCMTRSYIDPARDE